MDYTYSVETEVFPCQLFWFVPVTVLITNCLVYFRVNGEDVRLMLWDTAGQEEFDAITKAYYRGENTMFAVWWLLGFFGLHISKILSYLCIKNFSYFVCEKHV